MPCFFLAEIEVHDPQAYRQYIEKARPIVQDHGGQYVVRSDNVTPVSGNWKPQRLIMVRFENKAQMQECFGSEEYQQIKHLREQSTTSRAVVVEQDAEIGKTQDLDTDKRR